MEILMCNNKQWYMSQAKRLLGSSWHQLTLQFLWHQVLYAEVIFQLFYLAKRVVRHLTMTWYMSNSLNYKSKNYYENSPNHSYLLYITHTNKQNNGQALIAWNVELLFHITIQWLHNYEIYSWTDSGKTQLESKHHVEFFSFEPQHSIVVLCNSQWFTTNPMLKILIYNLHLISNVNNTKNYMVFISFIYNIIIFLLIYNFYS